MNKKEQKKYYTLDAAQANATLQNVFAACDAKPNTVPFDKILLRSKANVRSFTIGKIVTLLFLILLFCFPLLLPKPSTKIVTMDSSAQTIYVEDHFIQENQFFLFLMGDNIDYPNCHAIKLDGSILSPSTFDKNSNYIAFPYEGDELNILIYTEDGQSLHLVLTPKLKR